MTIAHLLKRAGFDEDVAEVIGREGQIGVTTDLASDRRGGATQAGISQAYFGKNPDGSWKRSKEQIAAMTPGEIKSVYRDIYKVPDKFTDPRVRKVMFDMTTNAGPTANGILQRSVNGLLPADQRLKVDNIAGSGTLAAAKGVDQGRLAGKLLDGYSAHHTQLIASRPDLYAENKNGWRNRVNGLRTTIGAMKAPTPPVVVKGTLQPPPVLVKGQLQPPTPGRPAPTTTQPGGPIMSMPMLSAPAAQVMSKAAANKFDTLLRAGKLTAEMVKRTRLHPGKTPEALERTIAGRRAMARNSPNGELLPAHMAYAAGDGSSNYRAATLLGRHPLSLNGLPTPAALKPSAKSTWTSPTGTPSRVAALPRPSTARAPQHAWSSGPHAQATYNYSPGDNAMAIPGYGTPTSRHELGHWAQFSLAAHDPRRLNVTTQLGFRRLLKASPYIAKQVSGNRTAGIEFQGHLLATKGNGKGAQRLREATTTDTSHGVINDAANAIRTHPAAAGYPEVTSSAEHLMRNYALSPMDGVNGALAGRYGKIFTKQASIASLLRQARNATHKRPTEARHAAGSYSKGRLVKAAAWWNKASAADPTAIRLLPKNVKDLLVVTFGSKWATKEKQRRKAK